MVERRQHRIIILRRIFFAQIMLLVTFGLVILVLMLYTDHLGSFFFAFLVGCIGGSLSLLRRLPRESDDSLASLADFRVATYMPILYGGVMAAVTYLLFMSGILTGDGGKGLFTSNLFPIFNNPAQEQGTLLSIPVVLQIRPVSVIDFGKLLVWCFMAGYSEKFVAGVLSSLESRGK